MDFKARMSGDNFHKRINTGRSNHLNTSTSNSFYFQENKSETYQTLIQILKSDLIQIQDLINTNSSDIKMYKLLSKAPGLTKKLSEIEDNKNINAYIEKISEDSKNIEKIIKIYNCKENELIQKIYLELSYNELLLKKIYDYFILMKLKLYKDDTYQDSLSKIISITNFMELTSNLSPNINGDSNSKIIELNQENNKLKTKIKEYEEKIENLENEIVNLKNSKNNSEIFSTEVKIKDNNINDNSEKIDFKTMILNFENEIKKSKNEFNDNIKNEIKELNNKINTLEEECNILKQEKENLEKNVKELRGGKIQNEDSYENILREQFDEMKEAFQQKIEELNSELTEIKQETRVKDYQMQEELKQSNYLKNAFLEKIESLQAQLDNYNK